MNEILHTPTDEVERRVLDFVAKERGMRIDKISNAKSINFDLGMDGDDAVEFFQDFAEKFSVDLTELGDEWDRYFGPEGFSLFPIWELITFKTQQRHPMLPLRVSRIVDAARTGKWTKLEETNAD